MTELKIDPKFRDLIPKLTDDEFAQLEKNILADGRVKEPIVVWKGVIIDGHHRYYIVQKHPEIPFEVEEREFSNEYAAMAWACANQLGRRNLNEWQHDYLIGERMRNEQLSRGNPSHDEKGRFDHKYPKDTNGGGLTDTASAIAKEEGIGRNKVYKDERLAKGLEIANEIVPGLKEEILSGDISVPKFIMQEIPKATPDKQRKAVKAISENNINMAKAILEKPIIKEPEPEPEPYNIDDLLEEVKAAQSELHFALNQILIVTHPDVVSGKEGKDKAIESLQDIMDDVQEFIEELLDMED